MVLGWPGLGWVGMVLGWPGLGWVGMVLGWPGLGYVGGLAGSWLGRDGSGCTQQIVLGHFLTLTISQKWPGNSATLTRTWRYPVPCPWLLPPPSLESCNVITGVMVMYWEYYLAYLDRTSSPPSSHLLFFFDDLWSKRVLGMNKEYSAPYMDTLPYTLCTWD